MQDEELLVAMSDRSLCIRCFASVASMLELCVFERGLDSRVDRCAASKRSTRMTSTFNPPGMRETFECSRVSRFKLMHYPNLCQETGHGMCRLASV